MGKIRHTSTLCTIILGLFLSAAANAAFIDGTIELAGSWTPVDDSSPTPLATTIDAATGIDFSDDLSVVVASSGDLSMTPYTTLASMTDFQFNPLYPNPVTLWAVGGFSFSMDNISIVTQSATDLVLSGSGTISGGGFTPTSGTWAFTGQTASNITFSWSSSNNTVVPVPAAAWLFGSGLLGLAGIARRKKAA